MQCKKKKKNTPKSQQIVLQQSICPSLGNKMYKKCLLKPWHHNDTFIGDEGATLCPNIQLMSTLSARPATVDWGVTAPNPVRQTKECTAVVLSVCGGGDETQTNYLLISGDTQTLSKCKQLHALQT